MKCFMILSVLVISTTMAKPQQQKSHYGVPQQMPQSQQRPQSQSRPSQQQQQQQQQQRPMNFQYGISGTGEASSNQFSQSSSSDGGNSDGMMGMFDYTPKVFKHISIHVAPSEEFEMPMMKRVIRPMQKPNKIVNIIFVKAPSQSSSQATEVILPSQPETRTVVYVLLKRPSPNSDIKIRRPAPSSPSKPEVFFIRYGNDKSNQENQQQQQQQQQGGTGSESQSAGEEEIVGTQAGGSSRPEYGVPSIPSSSSSSNQQNSVDGGYQS